MQGKFFLLTKSESELVECVGNIPFFLQGTRASLRLRRDSLPGRDLSIKIFYTGIAHTSKKDLALKKNSFIRPCRTHTPYTPNTSSYVPQSALVHCLSTVACSKGERGKGMRTEALSWMAYCKTCVSICTFVLLY
jgi:hypothetical protein